MNEEKVYWKYFNSRSKIAHLFVRRSHITACGIFVENRNRLKYGEKGRCRNCERALAK